MSEENQILLEKLKKYLSVSVCKERYDHSMRTAQTAKELCLRFGEDAELGEIAGVAHDICKEMKSDLLLNLVSVSEYEISQIEKDKSIVSSKIKKTFTHYLQYKRKIRRSIASAE